MAPFIKISEITKEFGDFIAVDRLSLDIEKCALFCLLGGSGCGKTTLLRMLAGLETPTSGTIEIDGINMAGVHPADRPVNYMFQNYALFPHMSVAKNIGYGLARAGISGAEAEARITEMLKHSGVDVESLRENLFVLKGWATAPLISSPVAKSNVLPWHAH